MKLSILSSRGNQRGEWILVDGGQYVVGRQALHEKMPKVNLSFDRQVSHRHCRIYGENGKWWIEDLHSKHGTQVQRSVNPDEVCVVSGDEAMRIWPGDEIIIGSTILVLEPHHRQRAWTGELVVEIDLVPSINYSLIHCGLPVVVRLAVRNYGHSRSAPLKLSIQLLGFGLPNDFFIPAIEPAGQYVLNSPQLVIQTGGIEVLCERKLAQVRLSANDTPILESAIWLLAYNEWSQERNHRLTLASFVQPNHPLIKQIELEARMVLSAQTEGEFDSFDILLQSVRPDSVEIIMRVFYDYFRSKWHLHYCSQPPCYESNSQKLRMPHQVLLDFSTRQGEGTCVDLALLLAACLEYLGLRPLLIMTMGETHWHHAMIGCWCQNRDESNPVIIHQDRLAGAAILCEATGVAERQGDGHGGAIVEFAQACREANDCMGKNRFMYALDIATSRREPWKVTPLPAVGEPVFGPAVQEILQKTVEYAKTFGSDHIGTLHLLLALEAQSDGWMNQVLNALHISYEQVGFLLKQKIGRVKNVPSTEPQPTSHYEQILAAAKVFAKRERSPVVQEEHVITALLESQGELIDKVLQDLGTGRAAVKKKYAELYMKEHIGIPQGLYC